jgi:hypothetical protein
MNIGRVQAAMIVSLFAVAPLAAQRPGNPRPARAALVRDIEQIFLTRVTRVMALTPEQQPRFQRAVLAWAQRRESLETEERQLRQSLNRELTPGVAANPDSVSRFVDALNANRVAYAESFRDEMRELAPILNPVQRGQFQVARDQLLQKVRELQQQRTGAGFRPLVDQEP